MKSYQCILFDLDHTLWDYESNSAEALTELFDSYKFSSMGIVSSEKLIYTFSRINTELWVLYDEGKIHRDVIRFERFHKVLTELGVDDYQLSLKLSDDYLALSPTKKKLMPHALDVLKYLQEKYDLIIITNGFDEIQSVKMESSGITSYFKNVVTSERAGHKKPSEKIFEFALQEHGFYAHETAMIGDNLLTDIAGAKNASIDSVFYNPFKIMHDTLITHEIHCLSELKTIF